MMARAAQRKEITTGNRRIFIQHSTECLGTVRMDVVASVKSIKSRQSWGLLHDRLQHHSPTNRGWFGYPALYYVSCRHIYDMMGHQRKCPSVLALQLWASAALSRDGRLTNGWLTRGWLVAVVSMSEVLGILHHWNASHPYDNSIRTRIQSTWGDDPMVDVMKRAGGVFLTTDYSNWTWKDTHR